MQQPVDTRTWDRLGYEGRHALLAASTPAQTLEQAQVIAQASRRSEREILNAWVALGYLSMDQAAEALVAAVAS